MFFRILKKDLQEKKGFNFILFVFMTVASMLAVVSALQIYSGIVGNERSYQMCNSSDVFVVTEQSVARRSEQIRDTYEWFLGREDVVDVEYQEVIRYNSMTLDFPDFEEQNNAAFRDYIYYVIKLPTKQNLVLDMEDNPFVVENGCVAIPRSMQMLTGAGVGDKIKITTQMGYVYEFKISHIFKDPAVTTFRRIIVSDSDFETLYEESPLRYDYYEIQLTEGNSVKQQRKLIQEFSHENTLAEVSFSISRDELDNDDVIAKTVTVFISIVGVFLILLILMTIRFTMISAVKHEECEIGILKAIGVNSLFLKWSFAVRYIAFSVIGGLLGVMFGIPLNNTLFQRFCFNMLAPDSIIIVLLAVGASLFSTLLIIVYTFLALRNMDKVNAMDALHGENKGERFKKLPGFFLHKRRCMEIPMFLAVTDLLGKIKRYAFLIIAYMMGISIILIAVQLRDSVLSEEYWKRYTMISTYEFEIHLNQELHDEYYQKAGDKQGVIKLVNEDLKEAGIPATVECINRSRGQLYFDGNDCFTWMGWGVADTSEQTYRKGSVPPKLYSEVAMDYYTAEKMGIEIGDTIHIEYDQRTEDRLTSKKVREDFIVTGFFDYLGNGSGYVLMGSDFDNAVVYDSPRYKDEIHAPESQKAYYMEKMCEIYGEDYVWDKEKIIKDMSGNYYYVLTLLRNVLSVTVILVLILITILYQNIFMEEEVASVALLKSMGFDNKNIKKWQCLRIAILILVSFVSAVLFTATFGNWFIHVAFEILVKLSGFYFIVNPLTSYLLVPFWVVGVIMLTLVIVLKPMEKIQIGRIRNE